MFSSLASLNSFAETLAGRVASVAWQWTALVVFLALPALWLLRSHAPALRYWIWQIVLLKLLAMPFWTYAVPVAWLPSAPAPAAILDAAQIQQNVAWLEKGQRKQGAQRGWSYQNFGGGGDNSNSDFAVWALGAAANTGPKVQRATWEAVFDYGLRCQAADGGWSYTSAQQSTGSMTSAGVASVAICLSHLTSDDRRPTKEELAAVERGLDWMKKHFAVGHNPQANQWLLYYAVMFRRAAEATKTEHFGNHDWRREFAEYFLSQQNRQNGTWRSGQIEGDPVVATSLVLLALVGAEPAPQLK